MMQMEQFLQQRSGSEFSPDLDLIEVLWRQDVDLGVGKEVFDPNLRKELEQERELEGRKEQEKRKEAERREQERQQQAQQWLSQNFIRDGETGELMPIAGSNNVSTSGPSSNNLYSESTFPSNLEEALNFVGELQVGHSYGPQPQAQQHQPPPATAIAPVGQLPYEADDIPFLAEGFSEEAFGHNFTNQTHQERIEQSWKEVVEHIFPDSNNNTTNDTATALAPLPCPEDPSVLLPAAAAFFSEPPIYHHPPPPQQQPQPLPPAPQLNASMDYLLPEQNRSASPTLSSMRELRRLLRENSTDLGMLHGLLHNATLPPPGLNLDSHLSMLDSQAVGNDTDMLSPDYNSSVNPVSGLLPQLDLERADLLFQNASDLASMADGIQSSDLLNSTDLLTNLLPVEDLEMVMDDVSQGCLQLIDERESDSAISMGSGSPEQESSEMMQMSPFDGLEGATGGSDYDNGTYSHNRSHMHSTGSTEEEHYQYSCSSYGSPASVSTNSSTGSNDTEHSSGHSSAALPHIHHNHTYHTQPGQTPREVKKYAKKDGPRQKGPQSRDMKRAEDLKLPFTFEQIVGSPVEEFNDLLTKTKLTEAQVVLMRDIRRRGKNKVAAQNCRKRKLNVLTTLEEEMDDMQHMRDKLREERRRIDQQTRQAKEKYAALYDHIFSSLRDEDGRPYNPAEFSLQESSDGNVFLVRRATSSATSPGAASSSPYPPNSSSSSSSSSSGSSSNPGKDCDPRQPKDHRPPQKKKSRE